MDIIIFHALFTEINLLQGDTAPLTSKELSWHHAFLKGPMETSKTSFVYILENFYYILL